ncbi:carboxypeptidase-like regulatory domain-containing protein [Aureivirga sp. CE67]|uniref:carboxypeptidase-like regulatory domain-containing protein n=1 Tax=Aureivirga sp. CE67 TaxID=1788983 RepID=UPI0018CB2419|nr:carboxypeptidase-like regulatory domain-containing protein [Aureivirga sp. CE67]
MYKSVLFFLLFLKGIFLFSQTISLKGTVKDSLNQVLPYTNIIAEPEKDSGLEFAISDEEGNYYIELKKGENYILKVSYIGFKEQSVSWKAEENTVKHFVLQATEEQLGEVILERSLAVEIKEDTIRYKTDKFVNGKERKLQDVLKKLPMVEVDKNGNVTVQGKKVTKVLVDGKQFFTGNSKLAVENIPADVVAEVEVLENYSNVSLLKGLDDTNKIAMNIKLKKNKKKFTFGNIEAGGGIKERYIINPTLYYYSPKTTLNFIGDLNNTGTSSFGFQDYMAFEGDAMGIFKSEARKASVYENLSSLIPNRNTMERKQKFAAFNVFQNVSKKTVFTAYGIGSEVEEEKRSISQIDYLFNDILETRENKQHSKSNFQLWKASLKSNPSENSDLTLDFYVKNLNLDADGIIVTETNSENNYLQNNTDFSNFDIKSNFDWHQKYNQKHTSSFRANYNFKQKTPKTNWRTDEEILSEILPLISSDTYTIFQENKRKMQDLSVVFKHYWVLTNLSHLYTTVGTQFNSEKYQTNTFQVLDSGAENNFSTNGFGNNLNYQFSDSYLGMQYKVKKGKWLLKPGLFYHAYFWDVNASKDLQLVLPEFLLKYKFNKSKKLEFRYEMQTSFTNIKNLANGFVLQNFNQVFRGNPNLENSLAHHFSFNFSKYSSYRFSYGLNLNYERKIRSFKETIALNGINSVNSLELLRTNDLAFSASGSISKRIRKLHFKLSGNFDLNTYYNPINSILTKTDLKNYGVSFSHFSSFKEGINYDFQVSRNYNFTESNTDVKIISDEVSLSLEFPFWKHFLLKPDYSLQIFENKTEENSTTFSEANLSLSYKNGSAPWFFECKATNIFDITYTRNSSTNLYMNYDSRTYILPRMLLFKIGYLL